MTVAITGALVGIALLVAGVAMLSVPAALIVAGVTLVGCCAFGFDIREKDEGR